MLKKAKKPKKTKLSGMGYEIFGHFESNRNSPYLIGTINLVAWVEKLIYLKLAGSYYCVPKPKPIRRN